MTVGRWVTPDGIVAARCRHSARVEALEPCDVEGPLFLPAPVDLHVHGAGGVDAMGGEAALRRMLAVQASLGCGALLATSVCAPFDAIDAFLVDVAAVMASPDAGSATLLGAHLEGPFVNPDKLGAQPPFAVPVDADALARWLATGVVRVVTFAPEVDERDVLPTSCAAHGARAQIGHTLCGWARAVAAFDVGCGVTHLWNAMSGAGHRDGGAAIAALARAAHAEIIPDGLHVDRAAFDAARRAIPGLYGITDGTAAVGMPDGTYRLGALEVHRRGDRVALADGTLAGSCLDQAGMLRVLRGWDMGWEEIARFAAARPADRIGASELGRIAPGARAHWLEVHGERPVALWLDGVRRELDAAASPATTATTGPPRADAAAAGSRTGAAPAVPAVDATERAAPDALALDLQPSADVVGRIVAGQRRAVDAVGAVAPALGAAVDAAAARLRTGDGRLVLLGAGASGRIAVQDGAELWPTFGWPAERLVLSIAGGDAALLHSVESVEDDADAATAEATALGIAAPDVVVAVAASGRSPWTVAWAAAARRAGALSVGMASNGGTPLLGAVDHPLLLDSGPEVLAGSTRMGAGTAQKAALNAFGTTLMVRLNRTWGNLMVDMSARNAKLETRRLAMLRAIVPGADDGALRAALATSDGSVKLAALVAMGDTLARAAVRLAAHDGSLRAAIASFGGPGGGPGGGSSPRRSGDR